MHVGREERDEQREEREEGGRVGGADLLHLEQQVVVDVQDLARALDQPGHLRFNSPSTPTCRLSVMARISGLLLYSMLIKKLQYTSFSRL